MEGVVQSMRPYGAFLDLGNGTVGLLHVSQISHERIISVDKILREGDRLKVRRQGRAAAAEGACRGGLSRGEGGGGAEDQAVREEGTGTAGGGEGFGCVCG